MPRNGSGTYSAPASSWNPGVNGSNATTADFNTLLDDLEAGLSQSVSSDGQTPMTGNLPMGNNKITGLAAGTLSTDAATVGQLGGAALVAQCRLTKSGVNLLLSRYNGSYLTINGSPQLIPSGGVTLPAGVLTPNTLYYIYAYMVTTVMTLEASTTGHSPDATTGIEVKTGDATRTLVGMARPITGPAWQDTPGQRFVVSFFNQQPIQTAKFFSSGKTTTSVGVFVELGTEIRSEFLTWAGKGLPFWAAGTISSDTASASVTTAMGLDGITPLEGGNSPSMPAGINNQALPMSIATVVAPAEGYHYITLLGAVGAGTGSWGGGASVGTRCSIQGVIQG